MNRKILIATFIILISAGLVLFNKSEPIKAGAEPNVSGWAWSENIGWISFNNTSGGGTTNYGVNVNIINNSYDNISGYAWSENIGWIKFDPAGRYPGNPYHSAKVEKIGNATTVTGWARACAGTVNGDCNSATRNDGWDGWISLSGSNYKVELKEDTDGCYLDGYAWGSDVVGWIRFSGDRYRVKVQCLQTTTTLGTPNIKSIDVPDYCTSSFGYTINWEPVYRADSYDIKICTDDAGSTCLVPETNIGNSISYTINTPGFNYGTTYYVFVRARNPDTTSEWSSTSFSTIRSKYPKVDFTWEIGESSGGDIVIGEEVDFSSQSKCYDRDNNITYCKTYNWVFGSGANPSNSGDENPQNVVFQPSSGNKITVNLEVTDLYDQRCSLTKEINVKPKWPTWVEVKPF
jgi:hypothetical protein